MSVLNKAKEHYKEKLGGTMGSVEVPEWETTVYFKQIVNFSQQQKIIKLSQEGKVVEALVETLIVKALDQDGKRMFSSADRDVLMREVDPDVILRVCTAINKTQEDDSLDAEMGN